ncbi:MAG: DUF4114 domain-containing protein, partial [Nostoc sp.]|uniref:DUF4114 domain-containing protein n=1 Tax=Nostoc sp. TaxID=1180 RepID=UPI002FFBFE7F
LIVLITSSLFVVLILMVYLLFECFCQKWMLPAAINSRVVGLTGTNQVTITSNGQFSSDSIFAPFIIANGDPNTYISQVNPVYFSFLGANPTSDKQVDHIRLLGNNTFGFEDLPNGGDQDFNDIIVRVNFI